MPPSARRISTSRSIRKDAIPRPGADEERGEANKEAISTKPGPESDERGDILGPSPQGNAEEPDFAAAQEIYEADV